MVLSLSELKTRWNEVLDDLAVQNRVAWLAFFDARLARLDSDRLYLNFIDSEKFPGAHDFKDFRRGELVTALEDSIIRTLQVRLTIEIASSISGEST